jgi:hypothetical protein
MDSDLSSLGMAIIPSELSGSRPRRLRLSKNGVRMATAAAVMLMLAVGFALSFAIGTVPQLQNEKALRHDGIETVGEITRLWSQGRPIVLKVSYTFVVAGVSYTGEARVPDRFWHGLRDAASLPIRYLPANPAISHPADWEWSAFSDWDSLAAPIVGAALALFLLVPLFSERRLVAKGLPAVGEITQCTPGRRGGFSVSFDFRAQDGSITKGRGWSESRQQAGERVCVLYFPQNPRRNLSYPSPNYRVAQ